MGIRHDRDFESEVMAGISTSRARPGHRRTLCRWSGVCPCWCLPLCHSLSLVVMFTQLCISFLPPSLTQFNLRPVLYPQTATTTTTSSLVRLIIIISVNVKAIEMHCLRCRRLSETCWAHRPQQQHQAHEYLVMTASARALSATEPEVSSLGSSRWSKHPPPPHPLCQCPCLM